MNWKEFIAAIVDSLAWPAVVVIAFFLFRERLGALVAKLARLKYKDLELDFDKLKEQAKQIGDAPSDSSLPSDPAFASLEEQILNTIDTAPSGSILLAWSAVEAAIASAVSRLAISAESPSYRSPLHNIDMLHNFSDLNKDSIRLLNEMRMLRNKVSHEHETLKKITEGQAQEYAHTAFKMINLLNGLKRTG